MRLRVKRINIFALHARFLRTQCKQAKQRADSNKNAYEAKINNVE